MKAYCLIREQPWYRRDAFVSGLKAAGLEVQCKQPTVYEKDMVLVIWNRYMQTHELALRVELAGGKVIVAENGYIGAGGSSPKFDVHPQGPKPSDYYALSLGFHNTDTLVRVGASDRFKELGIDLKPWRTEGEYILVCPNRSFGVGDRMMHPDWDMRAAASIRKHTQYPVRVRKHPGNSAPKHSLAEDLAGALAVVIWSSSCGVHALAAGIPVVCEAPYWICKQAALENMGQLIRGGVVNRRAAFERLAWAQWTCEEIASGKPFSHLLSNTE